MIRKFHIHYRCFRYLGLAPLWAAWRALREVWR